MTRPRGWSRRLRVRRAALALALLAVLAPARLHAPGTSIERPQPRWRPPVAERGVASWYGWPFHGRLTASGERYDMFDFTAASRTLPLGAVVEVVRKATGRAVVVRITDRGPYVDGRILDLSYAAAHALGMVGDGLAEVEIYRAKEEA